VNGKNVVLEGEISVRADPGYLGTSKMISETAFCLAFDCKKGGKESSSGFLTPATACGEQLITRLKAAGFKIEILDKKEK